MKSKKAHPDVFNTLLQVLDDGRLTDGKGRTVSFLNTVVIMTSNIGSDMILDWETKQDKIGFKDGNEKENDESSIRDRVMGMLKDHFRPEFLNRLDEIVMFHSLSKSDLQNIVDIQLELVVERLRAKRIIVSFTDKLKKLVAEKGYDPSYGARPLKRAIQEFVLNPLSLQIIAGKFADGGSVTIDAQKGKVVITS